MRTQSLRTTLVVSLVMLLAVPLLAQTHFASLTGTVISKDGNPLPKVELVATNQATQVTYTGRSNDAGLYTISALPIGTYKLRAQAPSFQTYETNIIKLESGQTARVDITMQVGGVAESVEVTGVAPILQTQDAVVGDVISGTTIQNMPLNGRNFSQLSLLLPGVITTEPDSFTQPKNTGSGRPFVNGQREQENNYMLDGVDMNEAIDNLLPYQPSPDALAEVRVETNNYSAEFGNVAGAIVGSTIKSGTNEFHGNVFEYWRDSSLAANSWDNNRVTPAAKKAELSQHIFGATLGGPIVKNKVFFFGDYQGFIRNRPGELVRTMAPVLRRNCAAMVSNVPLSCAAASPSASHQRLFCCAGPGLISEPSWRSTSSAPPAARMTSRPNSARRCTRCSTPRCARRESSPATGTGSPTGATASSR